LSRSDFESAACKTIVKLGAGNYKKKTERRFIDCKLEYKISGSTLRLPESSLLSYYGFTLDCFEPVQYHKPLLNYCQR